MVASYITIDHMKLFLLSQEYDAASLCTTNSKEFEEIQRCCFN